MEARVRGRSIQEIKGRGGASGQMEGLDLMGVIIGEDGVSDIGDIIEE